MMFDAAGHPAVAPEAVERDRLLSRLDGPERFCVLHAPSGMGKTVLLAQWTVRARRYGTTVLWLDLSTQPQSRSGFWLRALTQLHATGLIDDATLAREITAIAESPDAVDGAVQRALDAVGHPIVLIVDGLPELPTDPETGEAGIGDAWESVGQDVIALLVSRPGMRCLVACRTWEPCDDILEDAGLTSLVLTERELALSPTEAHTIADTVAPLLPRSVRDAVADGSDAQLPERLRFRLREAVDGGSALPQAQPVGTAQEAPWTLVERIRDPRLRDFTGAVALAPVVDEGLARTLTGREDAAALLHGLERSGAGVWTTTPTGARVFRFGDGVRAAASADFLRRSPDDVSSLRRKIARWVFDELRDDVLALEYALEARDLTFASHVALRAYPFTREAHPRILELVRAIPAAQIHRHPILALWYGLVLNADPSTQGRAAEFFVSATAVGRLLKNSLPAADRAVLRGIESSVWRLTGHPKRMAQAARACLDLFDEAYASPTFDERLSEVLGAVLSQAGISLYYAYDHEGARRAFSALVDFAQARNLRHRRNLGLGGLAFVDAISGNVNRARRTLAGIVDADWPAPWRSGYQGSLTRIARAWVHLSEGEPQRALDEVGVLEPHFDTIEHWDLILTVQVLAESMLGRSQEAAYRFARTRSARLRRTSLPSAVGRVVAADTVLDIITGGVTEGRKYGRVSASQTFVHGATAIFEAMRGDAGTTAALLRSAEEESVVPVHEMFAATAKAICAIRLDWREELFRAAARITAVATDTGLRWPLVLLTVPDRERLLSALTAGGSAGSAEQLRRALRYAPPLVRASTWQTGARPTLSRREQVVLHALFTTSSRAEIAENLFVSVNTVKTQMRSLYAKLGASTREEVLDRAIALGLASPQQRAATERPEDAT